MALNLSLPCGFMLWKYTKLGLKRSENSIKSAIKLWPCGTFYNELTSDGYNKPIKIKIKITVKNNSVIVDYSGTSQQSLHGINVVSNYSHAYTVFALKCLTRPHLPNNAGSFKPFQIYAPKGCILNATYPAPVAARHTIGQLLVEKNRIDVNLKY